MHALLLKEVGVPLTWVIATMGNNVELKASTKTTVETALKSALRALHGKNLVFVDLHVNNVICRVDANGKVTGAFFTDVESVQVADTALAKTSPVHASLNISSHTIVNFDKDAASLQKLLDEIT